MSSAEVSLHRFKHKAAATALLDHESTSADVPANIYAKFRALCAGNQSATIPILSCVFCMRDDAFGCQSISTSPAALSLVELKPEVWQPDELTVFKSFINFPASPDPLYILSCESSPDIFSSQNPTVGFINMSAMRPGATQRKNNHGAIMQHSN